MSSETISKIIIGSFYDIVKHAFPSLIGTQTNWWYGWLILKEHICIDSCGHCMQKCCILSASLTGNSCRKKPFQCTFLRFPVCLFPLLYSPLSSTHQFLLFNHLCCLSHLMSPMLSCCGRLDRVETRIGDQINQVSYGIPRSALPSATSMKMCSCYNFAWLFLSQSLNYLVEIHLV